MTDILTRVANLGLRTVSYTNLVRKADDPDVRDAVAEGLGTIGPAAVAPVLRSLVEPERRLGALAALDRGDVATHDRLAIEAAGTLKDCDAIALEDSQVCMIPYGQLEHLSREFTLLQHQLAEWPVAVVA